MGGLFSSPSVPAPPPPTPMADEQTIMKKRRRAIDEQIARGGRMSTIMSVGQNQSGSNVAGTSEKMGG